MFVDASTIVTILSRELEADALADLLDAAGAPITSPIALSSRRAGHLPQSSAPASGLGVDTPILRRQRGSVA